MTAADPPEARDAGAAPAGWALPNLVVDRDGDWLEDGEAVTHPRLLASLREGLRRDAQGYFIQTRVRVPVTVVDAPWVVVRVERRGDELRAFLNDGTDETVDPATLEVRAGHVPYCTVKSGRFPARLSRAAAFQLLGMAESGPGGADVLRLGDRTFTLRRSA